MTQKGFFVVLCGNIGAGKTKLAHLLAHELNRSLGLEPVRNNPYLADFYHDMPRWSFHLGVFFLVHRIELHNALFTNSVCSIADRSVYEDAFIFMPALFETGAISERDYGTYMKLWRLVEKDIPAPDLLLYLKAPAGALLKRIASRRRAVESGITLEYLLQLELRYRSWLQKYRCSPLMTIDSANTDFRKDRKSLNSIIDRVLKYKEMREHDH